MGGSEASESQRRASSHILVQFGFSSGTQQLSISVGRGWNIQTENANAVFDLSTFPVNFVVNATGLILFAFAGVLFFSVPAYATSAKGRGAARESGLSRSRKHASKRERGDVHRKNGHVPVAIRPRWEGCTCHAQTASRPDTTMRRTPCPGEPRSALGTQTQHCRIRQWWIELRSRGRAKPTDACESSEVIGRDG